MDIWELSDLATPWCIYVVATLRVSNHMAEGPVPVEDLAAACGADPAYLLRVLRQLVSKGIYEEPLPGRFALNEPAQALREEGVCIGLDLDSFGGRMANAWSTLLSAVRTGRPAYHERSAAASGKIWTPILRSPPASTGSWGPKVTVGQTLTSYSMRRTGRRYAPLSMLEVAAERSSPKCFAPIPALAVLWSMASGP